MFRALREEGAKAKGKRQSKSGFFFPRLVRRVVRPARECKRKMMRVHSTKLVS
jgi:hypothetical protein